MQTQKAIAPMQTQKTIAPTAPVAAPAFHRIWPPAIIACALALTAAWVCTTLTA
jgi:hypothetical protein